MRSQIVSARNKWLNTKYHGVKTLYDCSLPFMRQRGVTTSSRTPEVIVSLTSFPPRFSTLHYCLASLMRQSLKPDRIILWLSDSLDDVEPNVGKQLERLRSRGLDIRWCDDLGPHKKIQYTLEQFPDAKIVTADDDLFYPKHWLRDLVLAHEQNPDVVNCYRAHQIQNTDRGTPKPYQAWTHNAPNITGPTFKLMPTNGSGTLFTRHLLHERVLDRQTLSRLCPTADDVWLKAMSLLAGVKVRKIWPQSGRWLPILDARVGCLADDNNENGGNDRQIKAVWQHFDLQKVTAGGRDVNEA